MTLEVPFGTAPLDSSNKVVVIGGGLAGLVAAYRLLRGPQGPRVLDLLVLEAAERVGGKLLTDRFDGFVMEGGADCFVPGRGEVESLATELAIDGDFVPTRPVTVRAYLRSGDRFEPLLAGRGSPIARPRSLLSSPLLSWRAKARLLGEPLVRKAVPAGDESLRAFLTRRLGRRAYVEAFEPLLAGVHGADPDELSAAAIVPHMVAAEANGRSLLSLGTARAARDSIAKSSFLSFRDGMSTLPAALAAALGAARVRTGVAVTDVHPSASGWEVVTASGAKERADAVVIATPSPNAACMLKGIPEVRAALESLQTTVSAVVNLAYPGDAVARPLDAHGYLNRRADRRPVSATTWSSAKFDGRSPADQVLLRGFVRGDSVPPEGVNRDAELVRLVRDELADSLGVRASPIWSRVHVWTVPVYGVGHPERVAAVRSALGTVNGLAVAGAWYDGVGIEAVVRSGGRAANAVQTFMESGVQG